MKKNYVKNLKMKLEVEIGAQLKQDGSIDFIYVKDKKTNIMKQFGKDNGAGAPTVFIPGGGSGAPVTTR